MKKVFFGFYETTSTTSEELFKIGKDFLSWFRFPIGSATMVLPMFTDMLMNCVRS